MHFIRDSLHPQDPCPPSLSESSPQLKILDRILTGQIFIQQLDSATNDRAKEYGECLCKVNVSHSSSIVLLHYSGSEHTFSLVIIELQVHFHTELPEKLLHEKVVRLDISCHFLTPGRNQQLQAQMLWKSDQQLA